MEVEDDFQQKRRKHQRDEIDERKLHKRNIANDYMCEKQDCVHRDALAKPIFDKRIEIKNFFKRNLKLLNRSEDKIPASPS